MFRRVQTQWRTGGLNAARLGLDYAAVYPLLDRIAKTDQDWLDLLDDLTVIEGAALKQMAAN